MLNETQNILERLAAADRAHQKEAGGRLLLRSVKYMCAAVLSVFIVDVIFHLHAGWRLGLLLVLIFGVFILAVFAWQLAFVRRNRLEHIARFLETRDPALGSRLINLLQLNEQTERCRACAADPRACAAGGGKLLRRTARRSRRATRAHGRSAAAPQARGVGVVGFRRRAGNLLSYHGGGSRPLCGSVWRSSAVFVHASGNCAARSGGNERALWQRHHRAK